MNTFVGRTVNLSKTSLFLGLSLFTSTSQFLWARALTDVIWLSPFEANLGEKNPTGQRN